MMEGGRGIEGLLRVGRWLEKVGKKCRRKEGWCEDLGELERRNVGRLIV